MPSRFISRITQSPCVLEPIHCQTSQPGPANSTRFVLLGELPRTESKSTRRPSDARVTVEVQRTLQVGPGGDPLRTRDVGRAQRLPNRATVPQGLSENQFEDAG